MNTPTQTKLSTEFIRKMLQGNFPYANRSKCMDVCKQLKRHINGDLEEMIVKRRPSESKEVKEYRTKIYVPITKTPLSQSGVFYFLRQKCRKNPATPILILITYRRTFSQVLLY